MCCAGIRVSIYITTRGSQASGHVRDICTGAYLLKEALRAWTERTTRQKGDYTHHRRICMRLLHHPAYRISGARAWYLRTDAILRHVATARNRSHHMRASYAAAAVHRKQLLAAPQCHMHAVRTLVALALRRPCTTRLAEHRRDGELGLRVQHLARLGSV